MGKNNNILNKNKAKTTVYISIILSIFALVASLLSITYGSIYSDSIKTGVFLESFMAGTIAQDIISVAGSIAILVLCIIFLKKNNYKIFVFVIGLMGYFLYAYGLYVITGMYTTLYLLYIIIFTLSIFGMIWGITSFKIKILENYKLPVALGRAISIFLLIIVAVFVSLWLAALIPFSLRSMRPDFYGVYVMDLCIVMPFLAVIAYTLLRKKPFSSILGGVALVVLFTLCLSLAIGESIAPIYNIEADYSMVAIFGALTSASCVFLILYLFKLRKA